MIKKIKELYNPEFMRVPLIIKCCLKFVISMGICLYFGRNESRILDIASLLMLFVIFFLGIFWVQFLAQDASITLQIIMQQLQHRKDTPQEQQFNKDMIDYTEEELSTDLTDEEEKMLKLLSNLIVGLIYLALFGIFVVIGQWFGV